MKFTQNERVIRNMKKFILTFFLIVGAIMNLTVEAAHDISGKTIEIVSEKTSLLMTTLQGMVLDCINNDQKLSTIDGLNVESIKNFVLILCQYGYAEVKGTDQECRSICVTAQGAIEEGLAKLLNSKEVNSVKAVFLTPLPTTPLRKEGVTEGLINVSFDSARQYTLDMRENTLRNLREAGATIIAAYSAESYNDLKKNEVNKKQIEVWEKECQHERVVDFSLNKKVPEDLVGALYIITDKEGKEYYLATQGIQAKDSSQGEAIWKKWLTLKDSENEGAIRSNNMLYFIEENGNRKLEL